MSSNGKPTRAQVTAANRAAWDASAPLHLKDGAFDALLVRAAEPGFSALDETLTDTLMALGPAGKQVVQIGCNNGRELVSMPALGAVPVLGIDQSEAFLDQARRLVTAAGVDCDFVASDIYALPPETQNDFDIALVTIGVLGWMPDLPEFFRITAGLLAPGGHLVIYETHPIVEMFDPEGRDPFAPTRSYFWDGPDIGDEAITYEDKRSTETAGTSYWYLHTLGDIVTASLDAGLVLERLTEHPHSNREPLYDIYEDQAVQLPMSYTLVARKARR